MRIPGDPDAPQDDATTGEQSPLRQPVDVSSLGQQQPIDDSSLGRRQLVSLAVRFEGALLVVAFALRWWLATGEDAPLYWDARDFAWGLLAVAPMLLFYYGCGDLRELLQNLIGKALRQCSPGDLAVIAVLAGVSEELLFRGVLEPFVARWNTPVAIVGVSLLFAVLHAMSPKYFLVTLFISLYFSALTFLWHAPLMARLGAPPRLVYFIPGPEVNLLRAIVAHTVYDFVALTLLARESARTAQFSENA